MNDRLFNNPCTADSFNSLRYLRLVLTTLPDTRGLCGDWKSCRLRNLINSNCAVSRSHKRTIDSDNCKLDVFRGNFVTWRQAEFAACKRRWKSRICCTDAPCKAASTAINFKWQIYKTEWKHVRVPIDADFLVLFSLCYVKSDFCLFFVFNLSLLQTARSQPFPIHIILLPLNSRNSILDFGLKDDFFCWSLKIACKEPHVQGLFWWTTSE